MSAYQRLTNYDGNLYGEPSFQGVEYDWEVPDEHVIGSPGGVSTTQHHWTKGFYGRGNTSSNIYAGEGPDYIAGEYGNLYQTGQSAGQALGYYPKSADYQFWKNEEPSVSVAQKKSLMKENFTGETNYDIIDENALSIVTPIDYIPSIKATESFSMNNINNSIKRVSPIKIKSKISPWSAVLILAVMYSMFDSWSEVIQKFVNEKILAGKPSSYQGMLIAAIMMTLFFFLLIFMTDAFGSTEANLDQEL